MLKGSLPLPGAGFSHCIGTKVVRLIELSSVEEYHTGEKKIILPRDDTLGCVILALCICMPPQEVVSTSRYLAGG